MAKRENKDKMPVHEPPARPQPCPVPEPYEAPASLTDAPEQEGLSLLAKEALFIQAYREGRISHYELGVALNLDRFETDELLSRNNVVEASLTLEDVEADVQTLDRVLGPIR